MFTQMPLSKGLPRHMELLLTINNLLAKSSVYYIVYLNVVFCNSRIFFVACTIC